MRGKRTVAITYKTTPRDAITIRRIAQRKGETLSWLIHHAVNFYIRQERIERQELKGSRVKTDQIVETLLSEIRTAWKERP